MMMMISAEHGGARGLRPAEDPGHRLVRQGDAGAAQIRQGILRHEDPRQTEGEETVSDLLRQIRPPDLTRCIYTQSTGLTTW